MSEEPLGHLGPGGVMSREEDDLLLIRHVTKFEAPIIKKLPISEATRNREEEFKTIFRLKTSVWVSDDDGTFIFYYITLSQVLRTIQRPNADEKRVSGRVGDK
jgi:hypothetical protein